MNKSERKKLIIAYRLLQGDLSIAEAAQAIGLSERQMIRIKKGVKTQGDGFVIHKSRGEKTCRSICNDLKQSILECKNSNKYSMANFSHFQELLAEHEGINLSKSTIYRILSSNGNVSPKKHRKIRPHKRRNRNPKKGMLVMIDASPHDWFMNGQRYSLHGAIDDATGEILALFFSPTECLDGYFQILKNVITNNGIPLSVYSDQHTIFRSPSSGKLSLEDELDGKQINDTQFGRAMKELGINLIFAKSPQAKGRIERLWNSLQSRLITELNVANIQFIDAANKFLNLFISKYNARFAVAPKDAVSAFLPIDNSMILAHILCIKETRRIDSGFTFSFRKNFYKLLFNDRSCPLFPRCNVTILFSSSLGIKAEYKGRIYDLELLDSPPEKPILPKKKKTLSHKGTVPSSTHPWRTISKIPFPTFSEPSDREIISALYNSSRAWR